MTKQMDRAYQGLIQRLQKRIDEVDKQLFILGVPLSDFANALGSLHDSFGKLAPMMECIVDEGEKQLEVWNGNKAAALRPIFDNNGAYWLEEFVKCISKCDEAVVKLAKLTKEEKLDEENPLQQLVKQAELALQPIKHHSEIMYNEFTIDKKTHDPIKKATKRQLVDVYDALVNPQRIVEVSEVVHAIDQMM